MMSARRRGDFQIRYGPWAVVTGALSGIGKATALQLGEAGLNLVIVGRRHELPNDVAATKSVVTPGLLSKILTYCLGPLTRPLRTRIMARVMGDMTKHQREASA